jgi:hypothetical protein
MYVAHSFAIYLPLDVGDDLNVEHAFVEFSLIIIAAHDFFFCRWEDACGCKLVQFMGKIATWL